MDVDNLNKFTTDASQHKVLTEYIRRGETAVLIQPGLHLFLCH